MELFGLIKRTEYKELPPRVEYELSAKEKSLMPILQELAKWANTSIAKKRIQGEQQ